MVAYNQLFIVVQEMIEIKKLSFLKSMSTYLDADVSSTFDNDC